MSTFVNNDVSSGAIVYASDHNTQGALIAGVLNGGIDNDNISTSAAIAGSKIADNTISGSKLTGYKITRQNNTTNNTDTDARILTGWGYMTPGAVSVVTEAVTFDTAFNERPIVTVSFGGDDSAGGTNYGDGGAEVRNAYAAAYSITTTGFTVRIVGDGAWSGSQTVFYQWMAIGR